VIATGSEAGGTPSSWHLELDNLGELAAVGVTARTFRPGDRVVVMGSRSRTERHSLYVRKLVRAADGFEYEQVGASPRVRTR
jgi:NADPH:quinone reductase-like Zn-dependent oxidoreductase